MCPDMATTSEGRTSPCCPSLLPCQSYSWEGPYRNPALQNLRALSTGEDHMNLIFSWGLSNTHVLF